MTIDITLSTPKTVHHNTSATGLMELALQRREARLASTGALVAYTGEHTGRAPNDKFIVKDALTEDTIWWDNNLALSPQAFELLQEDFLQAAADKELFVQDLYAGADRRHRLHARIYTEYAWHALFSSYLLRRPSATERENFDPEFTVLCLPSFRADPKRHGTNSQTVIACDFSKKLVLIGGTSYAGEIKKAVFGYLNFVLPRRRVLPMHCSANVGKNEGSAVFFGLSGTGKTTLSSDPERDLLGDDEHGWSNEGIFNFEGGCYAKTIRLSRALEPEIWDATNKFGTILENVVVDPESRIPDFDDGSLTENTRSAYPLEFIANASATSTAGHPTSVIMLTADAFGILPPIAKLTPAQAMYHFLSGYTAKVAGTEKGVGSEPTATFSTCFGAPFMPLHPRVYGNMLRQRIGEHNVDCWLVNTGWTGGKYGTGSRMPLKVTRALLTAALSGALKQQPMRTDPVFGLQVPKDLDGIDASILDASILDPRETWADKRAYDAQARELAQMFRDNFRKFEAHVDADVLAAAPRVSQTAAGTAPVHRRNEGGQDLNCRQNS